ncbi:MAG: hypothetical protein VX730_05540 [Pseudomonadota bacterium]|nr:hypothetical protein [Pseudomonadota bacterium]
MAKKKGSVERFDVGVIVGKRTAGKFLEIVDACDYGDLKLNQSQKQYRALVGCIRFMYEVAKSWKDADDYAEKHTGYRKSTFKITATPTRQPPHQHNSNYPVIPVLNVKGIEEDDKPVHYSERLLQRDIACMLVFGRFLGIHLTMNDVLNQTREAKKKTSLIINTMIYYAHVILIDRGKRNIRDMGFVVKTNETPSSEDYLPLICTSTWKDFIEEFLRPFCQEVYFKR